MDHFLVAQMNFQHWQSKDCFIVETDGINELYFVCHGEVRGLVTKNSDLPILVAPALHPVSLTTYAYFHNQSLYVVDYPPNRFLPILRKFDQIMKGAWKLQIQLDMEANHGLVAQMQSFGRLHVDGIRRLADFQFQGQNLFFLPAGTMFGVAVFDCVTLNLKQCLHLQSALQPRDRYHFMMTSTFNNGLICQTLGSCQPAMEFRRGGSLRSWFASEPSEQITRFFEVFHLVPRIDTLRHNFLVSFDSSMRHSVLSPSSNAAVPHHQLKVLATTIDEARNLFAALTCNIDSAREGLWLDVWTLDRERLVASWRWVQDNNGPPWRLKLFKDGALAANGVEMRICIWGIETPKVMNLIELLRIQNFPVQAFYFLKPMTPTTVKMLLLRKLSSGEIEFEIEDVSVLQSLPLTLTGRNLKYMSGKTFDKLGLVQTPFEAWQRLLLRWSSSTSMIEPYPTVLYESALYSPPLEFLTDNPQERRPWYQLRW